MGAGRTEGGENQECIPRFGDDVPRSSATEPIPTRLMTRPETEVTIHNGGSWSGDHSSRIGATSQRSTRSLTRSTSIGRIEVPFAGTSRLVPKPSSDRAISIGRAGEIDGAVIPGVNENMLEAAAEESVVDKAEVVECQVDAVSPRDRFAVEVKTDQAAIIEVTTIRSPVALGKADALPGGQARIE